MKSRIGASTVTSRQFKSFNPSLAGFSTLPRNIFWNIHSMYTAARITPNEASPAYQYEPYDPPAPPAPQAPSRMVNSPMNPLSPGKPIEDNETISVSVPKSCITLHNP